MIDFRGLKCSINQYNVLHGYFSHGTLDDMGEHDTPKHNNSWTRAWCLKNGWSRITTIKHKKRVWIWYALASFIYTLPDDAWLYASILWNGLSLRLWKKRAKINSKKQNHIWDVKITQIYIYKRTVYFVHLRCDLPIYFTHARANADNHCRITWHLTKIP